MALTTAPSTRTPITLASRDSLLAMAQTIDAGLRLRQAGFTPRIITLKTAGDLKLDAPLFSGKEGRAFFTRELDDALLTGKADAAVHSFKDLPTEKIPGISEPVFFSEVAGADVLIARSAVTAAKDAASLVIGTSSLRRIHQLGLVLPAARTEMLRGNIVTRLRKLVENDRGMNAILIAAAGITRLTRFASVDAGSYEEFLQPETRNHVLTELEKFREYSAACRFSQTLDESFFPTAPGQGVLALQLSETAAQKFATRISGIFAEHERIFPRVMIERDVMSGLATGCHAPLGVSASESREGEFRISLCFSRESSADPVSFSDSVFLRRSGTAAQLVSEIRRPFKSAFWWGFKNAPENTALHILSIAALKQHQLDTPVPAGEFSAVFIASPAVLPWLKNHTALTRNVLFAAGKETERLTLKTFPAADVRYPGRGFEAALAVMRRNPENKYLWLGSRHGEARARSLGADMPKVAFLAVYENTALPAEELAASCPELGNKALVQEAIHLVTSAAAAESCVGFMRKHPDLTLTLSCFGESAAAAFRQQGFTPYHTSAAETFSGYLSEIQGDTRLMMQQENTDGK